MKKSNRIETKHLQKSQIDDNITLFFPKKLAIVL